MNLDKLTQARDGALTDFHERNTALEEIEARIMESKPEEREALQGELEPALVAYNDAKAELERCKGNLAAAEQRAQDIKDNPLRAAQPRGGTRTESTYREDRSSIGEVVLDLLNIQTDADARDRISANNKEQRESFREKHGVEMRDVGTGAFAGLTVPQYLTDEFVPLARAGAPFFASVPKSQLPSTGMTLNVGRVTTGSAVAAQATENTGVQETDIDDTLLTVNIRQYAGQNDISRQAASRSAQAVEAIFQDLIADWYTKVDSALINADGTSGTVLGIRSTASIISVAYTDASPTVPEVYPKLADAIQQIAGARFAPATTILMHARRWGWGTAALDSSNRPLFIPSANGPFNALAVGNAPDYGAVVGTLHGLPVITDNNIPTNLGAGTNEDMIFVVRLPDHRAWVNGDGTPMQLTFEQSNAPQSIRLAIWGEVAYTAGRYPASSATIGGTGLVTPTF